MSWKRSVHKLREKVKLVKRSFIPHSRKPFSEYKIKFIISDCKKAKDYKHIFCLITFRLPNGCELEQNVFLGTMKWKC